VTGIVYLENELPGRKTVIALYEANGWSSARRPDALMKALAGSHHLVTAFDGNTLVGLANAISDGHLVVYYPHLLVHPDYQGRGIGRALMARMVTRYADFHQQTLLAVAEAAPFYERAGFTKAGTTVPMWIYEEDDA